MANNSDDGYDWQDNSNKCYELAIKALRLKYVAEGKDVPRNEEERRVATLVQGMAQNQERLGPEFEKVLFDNLWELYAR